MSLFKMVFLCSDFTIKERHDIYRNISTQENEKLSSYKNKQTKPEGFQGSETAQKSI